MRKSLKDVFGGRRDYVSVSAYETLIRRHKFLSQTSEVKKTRPKIRELKSPIGEFEARRLDLDESIRESKVDLLDLFTIMAHVRDINAF